MKFNFLFLFFCTFSAQIWAQVKFTFKEWEDPATVELGKEPAHTYAMSYPNAVDLFENDFSKSPYYQSLNGSWKFYYVNRPE